MIPPLDGYKCYEIRRKLVRRKILTLWYPDHDWVVAVIPNHLKQLVLLELTLIIIIK